MPVNVEVSVTASHFLTEIGKFRAVTVRAIQLKLARVTGPRWLKMARRLTRRDTGRLRRSLKQGVSGRSPIVLKVFYDAAELLRSQVGHVRKPRPYAQWVEYGTKTRPGDDVLFKTKTRQEAKTLRDIKEAVEESARGILGR